MKNRIFQLGIKKVKASRKLNRNIMEKGSRNIMEKRNRNSILKGSRNIMEKRNRNSILKGSKIPV